MIKTECPRCNRMYQRIDVHTASCERLPLPDEVRAYMIKNRPTLSTIIKKWGVSQHFAEGYIKHFELSQYIGVWDKSKLQVQPATGDSKCVACGVKTFHSPPPSWGNVGVIIVGNRCEWCHEKGYTAVKFRRPSSFTNEDIVAMRAMRENGETYQEIAQRFGATYSYVQRVCTGVSRLGVGGYIEKIS